MFYALIVGVILLIDGSLMLFVAGRRRKMLAAAETPESSFEKRYESMHGDSKVKLFQWIGFFLLAVGAALVSIAIAGGFGEWEVPA
jgi:hypothetical protein